MMTTRKWKLTSKDIEEPISEEVKNTLEEIKIALTYGELIGLPTETVYGLAGDARNAEAIHKIFVAKGRPGDNPLIVHIHDTKQMEAFVEPVHENVKKLMDAFWPGPISFILPLKGDYISSNVVAELDSIAVRMPSHPVGRKVLQYANIPLAAPSANLSGKPSPTSFDHVYEDLDGKIYGVIESEPAEYGLESTVLDCTQFPYRIARPGAISITQLREVLKEDIERHRDTSERPISPGMKYKHYAPRQPLTVFFGNVNAGSKALTYDKNKKTGVIAPETMREYIKEEVVFVSLCKDETSYREASKNLYAALRFMDSSDVEEIFIYGFDINDETEALMNRIYKATGNTVIRG